MDIPVWFEYLFKGVVVFALLAFAAMAAARAGRSPYGALLLLLPVVQVVVVWAFAFARWPAVDRRDDGK